MFTKIDELDKKELFAEITANRIKVLALTSFSVIITLAVYIYLFNLALKLEGEAFCQLFLFLLFSFFITFTSISNAIFSPLSAITTSLVQYERGKILDEQPKDIKEKMLADIVEELKIAGLLKKKPKVYIVESEEPNAFVVSKGDDAIICVHDSLLKLLNRNELAAVIAHEISHAINRDSEIKLFLAAILSSIYTSTILGLRTASYRSYSSSRDKGGGAALYLLIGVFSFIVLFVILLLSFYAISRRQEKNADIGALKLTRDKYSLISALNKIDNYTRENLKDKKIERPTIPSFVYFWEGTVKDFLLNLFSTHPPIKERIAYLEKIA